MHSYQSTIHCSANRCDINERQIALSQWEKIFLEQLWSITQVEGKLGLSRIDEKILKRVIKQNHCIKPRKPIKARGIFKLNLEQKSQRLLSLQKVSAILLKAKAIFSNSSVRTWSGKVLQWQQNESFGLLQRALHDKSSYWTIVAELRANGGSLTFWGPCPSGFSLE